MKTMFPGPYLAWLVVFLCSHPFLGVRGMPAGGALPPGIGAVKKVIACEDQKAYIACANLFNSIDIVSAMFGRKDPMVCVSPGQDPASPCTAQEEQIKQDVKDLCQGEHKCEVSASNDFLAMEGTVICPNVMKYLEIQYRCLPKTAIVDSEGEVTTNAITELINGASSSSSSSLSSNQVLTSASASASASASSSSAAASSLSSSASEVQVLLDSPPFTRSESNVVEQLGVDQPQSSQQNSQEVTESMQMTQSDKRTEEKVESPNSVTETIAKKSHIERVLPEETGSEIEEEEEDDDGSGMDEMDDGEDEESTDAFNSDEDQEYVNE